MMGIGQAVTVEIPAGALRPLNLTIENEARRRSTPGSTRPAILCRSGRINVDLKNEIRIIVSRPGKHSPGLSSMNDQSRRRFVKSSVAAGLAAGLPDVAPRELFVHHVLFYLKNPGSAADKAKLLEGLNKLAKVPMIKMVHIGQPAGTTRDVIERSYTYSWLCFFDSPADEELYQKHPIHDDFRASYASLWEKVVIYDAIGPKR